MRVDAALDFILSQMIRLAEASARVQAARAEGRTSLTDEEVKQIQAIDDEARARLVDAINSKE